ncbi:hypothetical protein [Capnocytophaga canis]|uniref:hypothetical protein n=1 Tax=Capnocytophaga canis TaxID=1848903 RepID=UPI001562347D|nr:hypothetical protein [Capnocytophaga canis]
MSLVCGKFSIVRGDRRKQVWKNLSEADCLFFKARADRTFGSSSSKEKNSV